MCVTFLIFSCAACGGGGVEVAGTPRTPPRGLYGPLEPHAEELPFYRDSRIVLEEKQL
jgi:hypothetical protein